MPSVKAVIQKKDSITAQELTEFIQSNNEVVDASGNLKFKNLDQSFKIPGQMDSKFRTIGTAAFLLKLQESTGNKELGKVLITKLYKPSETAEKVELATYFSNKKELVPSQPTTAPMSKMEVPRLMEGERVLPSEELAKEVKAYVPPTTEEMLSKLPPTPKKPTRKTFPKKSIDAPAPVPAPASSVAFKESLVAEEKVSGESKSIQQTYAEPPRTIYKDPEPLSDVQIYPVSLDETSIESKQFKEPESKASVESLVNPLAFRINTQPAPPTKSKNSKIKSKVRISGIPIIDEPTSEAMSFTTVDGRSINFSGTTAADRIDQAEYFFNLVSNTAGVHPDVVQSAQTGLNVIREGVKTSEQKESIWSKVLGFSKFVLGAVASIPIIPPPIRAAAAGVLVGVTATEAVVAAVKGDFSGKDAIQAGVSLVGDLTGKKELADNVNTGLDVVDGGIKVVKKIKDAVNTPIPPNLTGIVDKKKEIQANPGSSTIENGNTVDNLQILDIEKDATEDILAGNQGSNVYYKDAIHPDALGIFFGSSEFPKWNETLLNNRKDRYSSMKAEEYAPYLQQQTEALFTKHGIDLLITKLKFTSPTDTAEMIIKENQEILQLWAAFTKIKFWDQVEAKLESIDGNLAAIKGAEDARLEAGKEVTGANVRHDLKIKRGYKTYNNSIAVRTDESVNVDGQKYFSEKQSLAEINTLQGAKPLSTRLSLSYGNSNSGPRLHGTELMNLRRSIVGTSITQPQQTQTSLSASPPIKGIRLNVC